MNGITVVTTDPSVIMRKPSISVIWVGDSNPAHLNPLSPVAASKRYVEFMGGADAVIHKSQK